MPDVHLRPMHEDEWGAWRARAVREYADDLIRNEALGDDAALAQAARELDELLTDGAGTATHRLFVAEDPGTGEPVGSLWYGPRPRGGDPDVAWLYEIRVEDAVRGRGLGRRLMELLEVQVRADGRHRIELNVFGDNERARRLYGSMGYREMARQMAKDLN